MTEQRCLAVLLRCQQPRAFACAASLPNRGALRATRQVSSWQCRGQLESRFLGTAPAAKLGVRGLSSTSAELVRHIAEQSQQPISKYSLEDLLSLQELSSEERLLHLNGVLHVGISKIVLLLQDLPLGFADRGPIRGVIQDYVQDLRDLRDSPFTDAEKFSECILRIFARHRGMLGQIARGLCEFQHEISKGFSPVAGLRETRLADVYEAVPAVYKIERTLDEFFTIRTTLRLLIAHCLKLCPEDRRDEIGHAMHEVLQRAPSPPSVGQHLHQVRHVGAICLDTRPSLILIEAYRHAHFMCQRRFDRTPPDLLVNGVPADEFLSSGGEDCPYLDTHFPYVDIHLYFVFFEVIKNALLATMRKAGPTRPIHASLISGTSLTAENERTVKITDHGEGISREDMRRVWSYFHSTTKNKEPKVQTGLSPTSSGRGLGLAVSRVLVRYFGGEIDLHSIPRKGTDVYIYL